MMCHRTIAVHDKNEKIKQKKQCMIKIEIEILNRKKHLHNPFAIGICHYLTFFPEKCRIRTLNLQHNKTLFTNHRSISTDKFICYVHMYLCSLKCTRHYQCLCINNIQTTQQWTKKNNYNTQLCFRQLSTFYWSNN